MLDHGARRTVDELVPVGDLHAARLLGLDLRRTLVGADQRNAAADGIATAAGVPGALDVGEPKTAAEQPHDEQSQRRRQHAAGARLGFPVTGIGVELGPAIGIDRSEMISHGYISSTGSTPMTARPEAMTIATPRTRARRARVSDGSAAMIKRSAASSLPLFHRVWNCAATSWR